MTPQRFRYSFGPEVDRAEVEDTLTLSLIAVAGLHGEARVRQESGHALAEDRSACVIEARGPAGRDLVTLFTTFLAREFGPESFTIEQLPGGWRERARR
jgi:hypothetical protein